MADIPYGYCHCGCGRKTKLASRTRPEAGWVKGEPLRYLLGHSGQRGQKRRPVRWLEQDCGYETPCWVWQLMTDQAGYGRDQTKPAHRVVYEQHIGPIPLDHDLDHLCRNPSCVNPAHLEPVPHAVNVQRGTLAKLTANDVREIRRLAGSMPNYRLGERFGVSGVQVANIVGRRQWANV